MSYIYAYKEQEKLIIIIIVYYYLMMNSYQVYKRQKDKTRKENNLSKWQTKNNIYH
jgi:hypothetical protein